MIGSRFWIRSRFLVKLPNPLRNRVNTNRMSRRWFQKLRILMQLRLIPCSPKERAPNPRRSRSWRSVLERIPSLQGKKILQANVPMSPKSILSWEWSSSKIKRNRMVFPMQRPMRPGISLPERGNFCHSSVWASSAEGGLLRKVVLTTRGPRRPNEIHAQLGCLILSQLIWLVFLQKSNLAISGHGGSKGKSAKQLMCWVCSCCISQISYSDFVDMALHVHSTLIVTCSKWLNWHMKEFFNWFQRTGIYNCELMATSSGIFGYTTTATFFLFAAQLWWCWNCFVGGHQRPWFWQWSFWASTLGCHMI